MGRAQLSLPFEADSSKIPSKNNDLGSDYMKLEKQFMQEFLAWENPYQSIETKSTKEKKWRLVSGMQKSIRRGQTATALRCAYALLGVDPSYLWSRIVVIALEDIGVCRPTAYVLLASQGVGWRKQFNQRDLLFFLVIGLSDHPEKTRGLTDLSLLMGWKSKKKILRGLMAKGAVPNPDLDALTNTMLGCVYSNMPQKGTPEEFEFSKEKFNGLVEKADAPDWVKWIALRSRKSSRHPFFPAVLPLWWSMQSAVEAEETEIEAETEFTEFLNGLPAAAYDQYTAEGKRSFAYFAKACHVVKKWFAVHEHLNPVDSLGRVAFYEEGGQLNVRLRWPEIDVLREESETIYKAMGGFKDDEYDELAALFHEHYDDLMKARKRILS